MNTSIVRLICRVLIIALAALPFQPVQAGMIGTDAAAAAAVRQGEREALIALIDRPEVARQIQAMGVDPLAARDRVAAMTDAETAALAGQVDALPAGARKNSIWGWVGILTVAWIIWYTWK